MGGGGQEPHVSLAGGPECVNLGLVSWALVSVPKKAELLGTPGFPGITPLPVTASHSRH